MNRYTVWTDESTIIKRPPTVASFFKGWSFTQSDRPLTPPPENKENDEEKEEVEEEVEEETFVDADDASFSSRSFSPCSEYSNRGSIQIDNKIRRKSSIDIGNEIMSKLLEEDNVKSAIEILKQALNHLNMAQQDEDRASISEIYSRIIKSLCDQSISKIVDEMMPNDKKSDIKHSILWRLFTKVIESGHVLQVRNDSKVNIKYRVFNIYLLDRCTFSSSQQISG